MSFGSYYICILLFSFYISYFLFLSLNLWWVVVHGEHLGIIRGLLDVLKWEVGFSLFSLENYDDRSISLSVTCGSSLTDVCCEDRLRVILFGVP